VTFGPRVQPFIKEYSHLAMHVCKRLGIVQYKRQTQYLNTIRPSSLLEGSSCNVGRWFTEGSIYSQYTWL